MADGNVTYRWEDYAHGNKKRKMTVTADESRGGSSQVCRAALCASAIRLPVRTATASWGGKAFDADVLRGPEDFRKIDPSGPQGDTGLLRGPAGQISDSRPFAQIFEMREKKAGWIAAQQLHRVLARPGNPENVGLELNGRRIRPLGKQIEERSLRTGVELEAVRVIAERQPGFGESGSPAIHLIGRAQTYLGREIVVRMRNPGQNYVLRPQCPGVLDGRLEMSAQLLILCDHGRAAETSLVQLRPELAGAKPVQSGNLYFLEAEAANLRERARHVLR